MPPHHQVGVRAQPGDVVHAPDDDVGLGELGEELLDLGALAGAVMTSPRVSASRNTDHIV